MMGLDVQYQHSLPRSRLAEDQRPQPKGRGRGRGRGRPTICAHGGGVCTSVKEEGGCEKWVEM